MRLSRGIVRGPAMAATAEVSRRKAGRGTGWCELFFRDEWAITPSPTGGMPERMVRFRWFHKREVLFPVCRRFPTLVRLIRFRRRERGGTPTPPGGMVAIPDREARGDCP